MGKGDGERRVTVDIDQQAAKPTGPSEVMFLEQILDDQPQEIVCPLCLDPVLTDIRTIEGDGSCFQACCPDPDITTTYHYCPNCSQLIGEVRRRFRSQFRGNPGEEEFDFEVKVHGRKYKELWMDMDD